MACSRSSTTAARRRWSSAATSGCTAMFSYRTSRVDSDGFDGLQRPSVELPTEGGGHPAESDNMTRLDGVDHDGPADGEWISMATLPE